MIVEFLSNLGFGRFMFLLIACPVAGFFIGAGCRSMIRWVLWTLVFGIAFLGMLVTADYFYILSRSSLDRQTADFVSNFFLFNLATYSVLYLLALWGGNTIIRYREAEERAYAEAMGPEDILRELSVLASHPELAGAGWFADRWSVMNDKARQDWIEERISLLQELHLLGQGQGFAAHGTIRLKRIQPRCHLFKNRLSANNLKQCVPGFDCVVGWFRFCRHLQQM